MAWCLGTLLVTPRTRSAVRLCFRHDSCCPGHDEVICFLTPGVWECKFFRPAGLPMSPLLRYLPPFYPTTMQLSTGIPPRSSIPPSFLSAFSAHIPSVPFLGCTCFSFAPLSTSTVFPMHFSMSWARLYSSFRVVFLRFFTLHCILLPFALNRRYQHRHLDYHRLSLSSPSLICFYLSLHAFQHTCFAQLPFPSHNHISTPPFVPLSHLTLSCPPCPPWLRAPLRY